MPAYKDGKRWRYRFTIEGRRYGGSTPIKNNTAKAAETLERTKIDQVMARRYSGVMPTLNEFSVRYLDYQKQHTKQLSHELNERELRVNILPHLGKLRIDQIRRAELDGLKTKWSCAPRTTNTRLGVIMRLLSLAVEWEILTSAPKVKLLKVPKDHPRFLTELEARALLEAAPPQWRSMVLVGLRTGLRIGELRGLQWGDIDVHRSVLHVRRTDPGRPNLSSSAPKGNRPRVVPLTPDTLACLVELHAASEDTAPGDWVWVGVWNCKGQRDRYRPRSKGGCTDAMVRMAELAGFTAEDVTWHTTRHTYASWLVMRNAPLSAVQELLGHALIRQTERYAHLSPGFAQHAAIAALDLPLMSGEIGTPAPAARLLSPPAGKASKAPRSGRRSSTSRKELSAGSARRRARRQHGTNGEIPGSPKAE